VNTHDYVQKPGTTFGLPRTSYTGKYDKLGSQMANWQLDAIIELLQKRNYKAMESPNTISGWQMSHSVNMPLAAHYSHFADNEFSRRFDAVGSSKAKFIDVALEDSQTNIANGKKVNKIQKW
jgi:hypothetical protein